MSRAPACILPSHPETWWAGVISFILRLKKARPRETCQAGGEPGSEPGLNQSCLFPLRSQSLFHRTPDREDVDPLDSDARSLSLTLAWPWGKGAAFVVLTPLT